MIVRFIVEFTLVLMLVILALDLLYLYYGGYWYDPVKAIEMAEVILLWIFVGGGLGYIVYRIREEWGRW